VPSAVDSQPDEEQNLHDFNQPPDKAAGLEIEDDATKTEEPS